jgi:hypothetical protein
MAAIGSRVRWRRGAIYERPAVFCSNFRLRQLQAGFFETAAELKRIPARVFLGNRLAQLDGGGHAGIRKMRDAISQLDQFHFDQILQVQLAYWRKFQTISCYVPQHPAEAHCPVGIGATRADIGIGDFLPRRGICHRRHRCRAESSYFVGCIHFWLLANYFCGDTRNLHSAGLCIVLHVAISRKSPGGLRSRQIFRDLQGPIYQMKIFQCKLLYAELQEIVLQSGIAVTSWPAGNYA